MSGFEDNIEEYIRLVKEEADDRQQHEADSAAQEETKKQEDLRRREAARLTGLEAVRVLSAHRIPTVAIWDKVKIGETRPHVHTSRYGISTYPDPIHALQNNRQGWKIMTQRANQDYDGYPIPAKHYSLGDDGTLQSYSATSVRNYKPSHYSESYDADGVIDPSDLPTYTLESLVNGEQFKKAVASLLAGLGEYEF